MLVKRFFISLFACSMVYAGGSAQQVTREQILMLFYKARQAQQAGDKQEAMTFYKEIINLQPRLPEPYQQLGDLYRTETDNVRSQERAAALYGFYLQLKPEATDYEVVKQKKEETERLLAELEQREVATRAPVVIAEQEESLAQKPPIVVQEKAVAEPMPEAVKPVRKEKTSPSHRVSIDKNLTGRWVSTSKAENGREAWILDVKEVNGEFWITINNKSAVKSTPLFDAMTDLDIQGQMTGGQLKFHFAVSEPYDPDKKDVMGTVGDFLGNLLNVDVYEWKLFSNRKKRNRSLRYEYAFELALEPYSLKGYIHTKVRDQADTAVVITNNTQACELFRAPMNYVGLTIPVWTEEEKRQDKELRSLFASTQKKSETDVEAMNDLGCMYWSGIGTRTNMKKAVDCFAGAAMENTHARLNLALLYQEGNGVEKDVDKARNWYLSAAEKGYVDAFVLCGDSYIFGEAPDTNYDTALYYYDKAIAGGSAFGLFRLGWLYKEGLGVKADHSKAVTFLEKAMVAGSSAACVELASLYELEGNPAKAVELLNKAASENSAQAISKLSEMYLRGEGVTQDFSKAKALEEQAARLSAKPLLGYNSLGSVIRDSYNRLAR